MKCPRCWTEKAYLRHVPGWKGVALACLLLRPLKCHHCYHKFVAWWFRTVGQQLHPPVLRKPTVRPGGRSYAAEVQKAPLGHRVRPRTVPPDGREAA